ncbi:MAG: hypothetical protein ISEC1_P1295 [Thiomicrorhabdus sp.]|nr:MAG: hypothetical protein ISEC1_P1295 [Thiomicrorhabdus sp.]
MSIYTMLSMKDSASSSIVNTATLSEPTVDSNSASTLEKTKKVKVWDPLIRFFHWSLVLLFALAYLSEDDFLDIHVITGYLMTGLIVFRLIWGLIGTKHARFSDFVTPPAQIKAYLIDILYLRPKHYLGHNPAGGAMVIALIVSISMTLLFGMLTYGFTEFSGPLAGWVPGLSDGFANIFEDVHEFFANFTLLLIAGHVFGVLVASLQHKENLVRSMWTGIKEVPIDMDTKGETEVKTNFKTTNKHK